MNLEEKQEHFEYKSPKDLVVHGEPLSPAKWNEKLLKIGGRCPAGDARLRIVWGGTAKKRGYAQLSDRSVEIETIKYPGPIPKVRNLVGFSYLSNDGKTVNVTRADKVPRGKMAIPRYDYYDLGMLRWMFERKFMPDELVALGMYPRPGTVEAAAYGIRGGRRYMPPMSPKGEYIGLYPLQTPEGKYWEPDDAWFSAMSKVVQETYNTTEGERMDALNKWVDRIEKAEAKAAEADEERKRTVFEDAWIEAEKAPQGRVSVAMPKGYKKLNTGLIAKDDKF